MFPPKCDFMGAFAPALPGASPCPNLFQSGGSPADSCGRQQNKSTVAIWNMDTCMANASCQWFVLSLVHLITASTLPTHYRISKKNKQTQCVSTTQIGIIRSYKASYFSWFPITKPRNWRPSSFAPALLGITEDSKDICNSTAVGPDTEAHEFRSS